MKLKLKGKMIVTDEKILRKKSELFLGSQADLSELIYNLEYAIEISDQIGVGLTAIQIGFPVRVGIVRSKKLKLNLINPEIINGSELLIMKEGCLSFPYKFIEVRRMNKIKLLNNNLDIYNLTGFEAQIIQHEIDHMNSILMIDRSV